MAFDFNKVTINKSIASDTSNYYIPNTLELKDAIEKNSDYKSNGVNALLNKLSRSIDFIQSNSMVQFTPGKQYKLNNIISVVFNDASTNSKQYTNLICVGYNQDGYCDEAPTTYIADDYGNIVFDNSNWNSSYWSELKNNSSVSKSIELDNFIYQYSKNKNSKDNIQARHVKLFDLSSVTEDDFKSINFDIVISRFSNLFLNCSISGNNSYIKFKINTINNIKNTYTAQLGNIWDINSIFKELALNGLLFSVDEANAKVYLTYLGIEEMLGIDPTFNVKIILNESDTPIYLEKENIDVFIDNNDIVIVPLTKGASNDYSVKTLEYFDYAYTLDNKIAFNNGLRILNSDLKLDSWLYPIVRKTKESTKAWEGNIYRCNKKYKYAFKDTETTRTIDKKFPNIKAKSAVGVSNSTSDSELKGAYYTDRTPSGGGRYTGGENRKILSGETDTAAIYPIPVNQIDQNPKFLYKGIDPVTGNETDYKVSNSIVGDLGIFNSDFGNRERLTTASIKTIPYIKLW